MKVYCIWGIQNAGIHRLYVVHRFSQVRVLFNEIINDYGNRKRDPEKCRRLMRKRISEKL